MVEHQLVIIAHYLYTYHITIRAICTYNIYFCRLESHCQLCLLCIAEQSVIMDSCKWQYCSQYQLQWLPVVSC